MLNVDWKSLKILKLSPSSYFPFLSQKQLWILLFLQLLFFCSAITFKWKITKTNSNCRCCYVNKRNSTLQSHLFPFLPSPSTWITQSKWHPSHDFHSWKFIRKSRIIHMKIMMVSLSTYFFLYIYRLSEMGLSEKLYREKYLFNGNCGHNAL